MIVLAVILLIGVTYVFNRLNFAALGAIFLILSVFLLLFCFRKSFSLSVFSSEANDIPICIGEGAKTSVGNGALYFLAAKPTRETDWMLDKPRAMNQDLQALGDRAIEKRKR